MKQNQMNSFKLEITYKDVYNVVYNCTPYRHELSVELLDGSIIKAAEYVKSYSDGECVYAIPKNADKEKYNALKKVADDYMTYIGAVRLGHTYAEGTVDEVRRSIYTK